jgi:MoaA/NifB/PqqE/SkfB family radical SAM enzyme
MQLRFAQIEPTTRCNYTCGFCVGRHMRQTDLSLDNFKQFIDQVVGLEAIELQGEGEPLLHAGFFDMIAIARAKFPDVEISMISNGSLFTSENINRLLKAKVSRIFVSAESVNDALFQKIRGGKLERVRRGIRALLAEREKRQLSYPIVGLSITVLRSTAGELHQAIPEFYQDLGLDGGVNIQPLQNMPQYRKFYNHDMLLQTIDQAAAETTSRAVKTSAALRQLLKDRKQTSATGFYEKLYSSVDARLECPWLANGGYLTGEGKLMACCHVKDYDRFAMANLAEMNKFDQIRVDLQKALQRGVMPEQCVGCGVARGIVQVNRIASSGG